MGIAPTLSAIIGGATAVGQTVNAFQQAGHMKRAAASAAKAAQDQAAEQQRAVNKANARKPDIANIMFGNQQGVSNTNLTGSAGAPVGASSIGSNTLLGQ
ncbi:hypothetical protein [Asticcacaulis solisilvae]|uniref:hypothetical protein n=1 Tax=Asticcacaulis solisilvae TaxID=1217274 RepID=UPI003FD785F9